MHECTADLPPRQAGDSELQAVTAPAIAVAKAANPGLEGIGPTPLTRSLMERGENQGGNGVNRGDQPVSNLNKP